MLADLPEFEVILVYEARSRTAKNCYTEKSCVEKQNKKRPVCRILFMNEEKEGWLLAGSFWQIDGDEP